MAKTLLELFLSFLKVGFTSFGGVSMVPLINQEMLSHNWMTQEEVINIIAIAEMTPGPLGVNCATFAGMKTMGVLGALVSSLGVIMPSITLTLVVAIFFNKFKNSKRVEQVMVGVRPATIGMIFAVLVSLILSNYVMEAGGISYLSILISLIDLVLFFKLDLGVPIVILLNAGLGIVFYYFLNIDF